MDYLAGVILAVAVALGAAVVGLDRDRAFYPTVMMVIASYYVLFAVMGGSGQALFAETLVMLAFVGVAALGFRRNLWLVVGALALHGLFDSFHGRMVANPGVPPWWPSFCLAYDMVAAAGLALLLRRRRIGVSRR